jgi:hypothetical protein
LPDTPKPKKLGPLNVERLSDEGAGKVRGSGAEGSADETVLATVKVTEPGYVPSSAEHREWIGDTIFTANLQRRQLAELEADPRVVAVELGQRLDLID